MITKLIRGVVATAALAMGVTTFCGTAQADHHMPGKGVVIQPGQDNVDGENFQTILVIKALKELGYEVKSVQNAKYPTLHIAIANGDVTFMADHWNPLHQAFYDAAGGEAKLSRTGNYLPGCAQGYLIDKKTADKYGISNIGQLKDPKIAKLFDANDDGKADLAGCVPGWGCERVIEHQMDAFGLRDTVKHNQGEYSAIIAETIARYKEGKPILYYTWTPYWVSGVLVPGDDVTWIEVPHSAHPNNVDTKLPNGKNYGFEVNTQMIVANTDFVANNPAAAKLFEVMNVSVNDVSAQNLKMKEKGEGGWKAAERHADAWIAANRKTFDSWLEAARAAAQ
ncbi:glycine betaine/L-proline ABC transporter substrate-binding protein ProX [Magnetovibrio blakemorei]|uniref:Glycine betaine ABC transporter substrate-binding protein n=1 Tax=Magnetovibrio blakemorei TaxID=28181 RepID=A0A1E5QCA5_9PROT|nr:glycine betaine/L-proline ABC transporter substrate-binding protein ProX [Magnetovibrio blakemorei]OEJ69675.1 glycine betaine ABC transporter substrate-binding protein [Magnetovibrio blakemorei]